MKKRCRKVRVVQAGSEGHRLSFREGGCPYPCGLPSEIIPWGRNLLAHNAAVVAANGAAALDGAVVAADGTTTLDGAVASGNGATLDGAVVATDGTATLGEHFDCLVGGFWI